MIDIKKLTHRHEYGCQVCDGRGTYREECRHSGAFYGPDLTCRKCEGSGLSPEAIYHMKWDRRFLELSKHIAGWSKDPSTKTGGVIVRDDRTIASLGYNGFAQGMSDDPGLYSDRQEKYSRVVHCEMNALLFCRDPLPLKTHTLYTTVPCCERCAVHMIQAGIRRFVFGAVTQEQVDRWNVMNSLKYMDEVRATILFMEDEK